MKTPEHLAAEYATKQHSDTHCKVSYGQKSARRGGVYTSIEQAFLAGYRQGYAIGVGVAVENLVIEQIEENE